MKKDRESEDMNATQERHCTPAESLEQSLKEVKQIKQGKKKAKSWSELYSSIKKDKKNGRL